MNVLFISVLFSLLFFYEIKYSKYWYSITVRFIHFFCYNICSYFKWIRIKKSLITADPHGFGSGLWVEQHIGIRYFFTHVFFPSSDCVPTRAGDAWRGRKENGGNPEIFRHLWTVRLQEEGRETSHPPRGELRVKSGSTVFCHLWTVRLQEESRETSHPTRGELRVKSRSILPSTL